jgi:hypothetical protein
MSLVWETTLSKSDISNGNIRFASSTLDLEPEFFGGTNATEPAKSRLAVTFKPGSTTQQWLYGDKKIFSNRNPHTRDFFASIGAKAGSHIRITRTSSNALLIEKAV